MEIMPRTVFNIVAAFYIMTATLSLVTAAPTTIASAPAAITTCPGGMDGNPAVLTFNQSQCLDRGSQEVETAHNLLCQGHFLVNGIIANTLDVSNNTYNNYYYYHYYNRYKH
jgi:hypothetical protein